MHNSTRSGLRALASIWLCACQAEIPADDSDPKESLSYYSSVVTDGQSDPILVEHHIVGESTYSLDVVTEVGEDNTLHLKSKELRVRLRADHAGLDIAPTQGWLSSFGVQVAVRPWGSTEEFKELLGADDGFFPSVRLDRVLGAYSGELRQYGHDEEQVGELRAHPAPALAKAAGDLEVRVRVFPIDSYGRLTWEDEAEVMIRDASFDLPFTHIEITEEVTETARTVRYVGKDIYGNAEVATEFAYPLDDNGDSLGLRLESITEGTVVSGTITREAKDDGRVGFTFAEDEGATLPGDAHKDKLRYLMDYHAFASWFDGFAEDYGVEGGTGFGSQWVACHNWWFGKLVWVTAIAFAASFYMAHGDGLIVTLTVAILGYVLGLVYCTTVDVAWNNRELILG